MESLHSAGFPGLASAPASIRVRLPQARKISHVSSHLKPGNPSLGTTANGSWGTGEPEGCCFVSLGRGYGALRSGPTGLPSRSQAKGDSNRITVPLDERCVRGFSPPTPRRAGQSSMAGRCIWNLGRAVLRLADAQYSMTKIRRSSGEWAGPTWVGRMRPELKAAGVDAAPLRPSWVTHPGHAKTGSQPRRSSPRRAPISSDGSLRRTTNFQQQVCCRLPTGGLERESI